MEPGFPKQIAEDFPGIDSKIDAVFEEFGKRILTYYVGHGALETFFDIRDKRSIETF